MGESKLIVFWSSVPGAGRRTLARELARHWTRENRAVLVIEEGEPNLAEEPDRWVPRFLKLSPMILRNYLSDPEGESSAKLSLRRLPPEAVLKDLLELAREAFEWILVAGPQDFSPESAAVLDASDLLLWVTRPGPEASPRWNGFLQDLARLHLPNQLAQIVMNRVPPGAKPAQTALAALPEDGGSGVKLRAGVRGLAGVLTTQPSLYRVRDKALREKTMEARAVEQIKSQVQPELLRTLDESQDASAPPGKTIEADVAQKTVEACLAANATLGGSREERGHIVTRVLEEVLGLGALEPLLKDPEISEVLVNSHGCIYVEKNGKLRPTETRFASESQLRTIIDRIVAPIGRRVDESSPLCDARLADGSRVNIVLPPLALDGPVVTIRKFSAKKLDLDGMVHLLSMSAAMAECLRQSVVSRQNIVVSGGTGSGKTTLLNALSSAIPDDERIVTIEDAAELRLQKPHVVRLESRPPNAEGQGAVPIRRLVMNALRMRPDRIVVGECRGGEALDMLQAMNTGHDGSLTTLHANSPRDALGRLETLVLMAGLDLPVRVVREQIRSAVQLIVQQARLPDGSRKVVSITELTGMEGDTLLTQEIFRFHNGAFEATGVVSATRSFTLSFPNRNKKPS